MRLVRVAIACLVAAVVAAGCGDDPDRADGAAAAMSDGEFWALVEQSRAAAGGDQDRQAAELRRRLATLLPERIEAYQRTFERREDESYRHDLWAAAYIVNGGCSDDCFDYFRFWLISRGRAVYERVLTDPGAVGEFIETADETQQEVFGSPALDAYEDVTGSQMAPRTTPRPDEPAGKRWEDDTVRGLYPALSKRFG